MIYLDFEFCNILHEKVKLVCCSALDEDLDVVEEFWLLNNQEGLTRLDEFIKLNCDEIFVAHSVVAEARSFLSLSVDPVGFKWIDTFLEQRCLTNHNAFLLYERKQLIDGKEKYIPKPKPKWERSEGESLQGFKPTCSLAETTYCYTGEIRDTEHKTKMRDIIISGDEALIEANREAIQAYCTEDVIFLPTIYKAQIEEYKELLGPKFNADQLQKDMLLRGEYAALTAVMESKGYPIDYDRLRTFSSKIDSIIQECQRHINDLFPEVRPFKFKKNDSKFAWNQKITKEWIVENHSEDEVERWMLTDGGKAAKKKGLPFEAKHLSLSLEAWSRFYNFQHDYPEDNFGAQMVRYLKLKQALGGFSTGGKGKKFWDFVGPDKRVRPYMNIYGSQSSRSQPSASGFMFLKPAWVRSLVKAAPGRAICGIDYGSQEFLISALVSGDEAMLEAYKSGDVYMYYGKDTGLIPKDGTKKTHKAERQIAKGVTLGLSYLMSKFGLANQLTQNTNRKWTEDEAQEQIDLFYSVYYMLAEFQEATKESYFDDKQEIRLPCGWTMWTDNDNFRSVCNIPIQGLGASIMRKAVKLAYDRGLEVIFTLHDALYIEFDENDWGAMDTLHDCMKEAFIHYFDDKESAALIRLDIEAWSDNYKPNSKGVTPAGRDFDKSNMYVDERARNEYDRFSPYFDLTEEDEL